MVLNVLIFKNFALIILTLSSLITQSFKINTVLKNVSLNITIKTNIAI